MDRLDAMKLFVRVVESGSFSAVAREVGIGQSAVSKQIAGLEAWLNTQLLNRTSRSLSLTETGRVFYEGCLKLTDECSALESTVKHGQAEPSGLVRVAVAPVFGRLYIVPHLSAFFQRFPAIRIELVASERQVNLVEENLDLAIRHGELRDSSLAMRKLAVSPLVTVASQEYLERYGTPQNPAELARHACITYTGGGEDRPWVFAKPAGARLIIQPEGQFRTNDGEHIRAAVLANMGIAQVPAWLVGPELASGTLRAILQDDQTETIAISALYHSRRRLNARVRIFVDFLADKLSEAGMHNA